MLSQDIEITEIPNQDSFMHTDDPPPEDDKTSFSNLIYEEDELIKVLGIDSDLNVYP